MKSLAANRVAGLLIVPASDIDNGNSYGQYKFPSITIVRKKRDEDLPFFMNDSRMGGTLIGRFIADEGRRNPAYIGVDLPISCNQSRFRGFAEALDETGIELKESRILDSRLSLSETYRLTMELVKKDPEVDSLFVFNDNLAFAALRAIKDSGLRAPDDIRVFGHDDVKEAQYSNPSLSTIKVPKYNLGYKSASSLLQLIENSDTPVENRIFEPKLIIRES